MTDDETKKAIDFAQREMVRALAPHIGTKPNPEAVRASVQQVLDSFKVEQVIQTEVLAEVIGDTIRMTLKQPSFLRDILPVLQGPYHPWPDIDNVVHVGGSIGSWFVRVCDYQRLQNNPGHRDMVVTCLTCLTSNRLP